LMDPCEVRVPPPGVPVEEAPAGLDLEPPPEWWWLHISAKMPPLEEEEEEEEEDAAAAGAEDGGGTWVCPLGPETLPSALLDRCNCSSNLLSCCGCCCAAPNVVGGSR